MISMISYELDFTGFKKILVMAVAIVFGIWRAKVGHEPGVVILLMLTGYYCWESHWYYANGFKPYSKLGAHMKRALTR